MEAKNMIETALQEARTPFVERADNGTPVVFLPTGNGEWSYQLQPDWRDAPVRKEGAAEMHDLDSLIKFVNKHKQDGTAIYIDADFARGKILVDAVIDGDTAEAAGWNQFGAKFSPVRTVSAESWLKHNNARLDQRAFAAHLTSYARDIVSQNPADENKKYPTAAEVLDFALNLEYTEKTTFKQGYREQDGRINFTFQSEDAGKQETNLKAFERFAIAFTPFQGGDPYFVEALLKFRIDKNSGALVLWYELQQIETVVERAARDIADKLQQAFADLDIYYGRPV